MMASVKENIKNKVKAVKGKVKGKLKRGVKSACLAFAVLLIAGCMTPEQASRSTRAEYDDNDPTIKVDVGDGSTNVSVNVTMNITLGDGALASADSSGSTESQTQTPNFDISPKTDLRYNDALSAASSASKGILETLTDVSKDAVLAMMANKQSGMVGVTKKDGTKATVSCTDGQCYMTDGGACAPASCANGVCTP